MFSFLRKRKPEAHGISHEQWRSSFKWYQKKRLIEEETPSYSSGIKRSVFTLQLKKKGCLAWVTSPIYRYKDFLLEGSFSLDPENGYSAAGFVLRHIDDENFYYVLISNKGYFRFDVVFNGNPIHLIEWTELKLTGEETFKLKVLAHGTLFSFYIEDDWIAEIQDETIPEGSFSFIAQNYHEKDTAWAYLHYISIDSRPVEVERAYYRWVHYVPARYEYRIALARTFFFMGRFLDATIQFNKALKLRESTADDYFLLAESYLKLNVYDQALRSIEKCLKQEPERAEALLEKANLLYLTKRFIPARDYILSIIQQFRENTLLWNLLGNCEYTLGNWLKARDAYQQAAGLAPESSLFRINLARTYERLGKSKDAVLTYLDASRLLFRQEDYAELALVLPRTRDLLTKSRETSGLRTEKQDLQAIEGKMLYHEGKLSEAEKLLADLIKAGYEDSAVFFLYGLIYIEKGKRQTAELYLKKATELESQYSLYWFRLAENRFLLGRDMGEALNNAYQLNPDDPWIDNLYGLTLKKAERFEEADSYFNKALELASGEADIYANYSDSLLKQGKLEQALDKVTEGIKKAGKNPKLLNQRGNIYGVQMNYATALNDYEEALRLDPECPEYMENCAACCIELDMIMRAEELLGHLLEDHPSSSVYNLTGNLSVIKREYKRAELSYREALKLDSKNREIKLNLASLYLEKGNYREVRTLVQEILKGEPGSERALALQDRLRQSCETRLNCATCGREWWVPQKVPSQGRLVIHGEPPSAAPAGKCGACGKVYCIGCAADHVQDKRFICPECGQALKLTDDYLKYLLLDYIKKEEPE